MNARLLFTIFYRALYTILSIVLLILLVLTPADAIHQALANHQLYNIFVIAGAYFVTVFFAIIIYASRLWTTGTVLKAIPKTYIPVEKGDVGEKVRKMIAGGLNRSAAIAWTFRPRADSQPTSEAPEPDAREPAVQAPEPERKKKLLGKFRARWSKQEKDEQALVIPPYRPTWDVIAHDGWSSPMSPDLPNLQYTSVILELPHLIEARAVSVAPPDPDSMSDPPMPDLRAVDLLQRPLSMGLRDYIEHLLSLDIITSPSTASAFLATYEQARFSPRPLTEPQFRQLMKLFADLLRGMQALSPAVLASLDYDESDIDADADEYGNSQPSTPSNRSMTSFHSASTHSEEGTIRTARSRGTTTPAGTLSVYGATPRSRRRPRIASANSFAQSRRPYGGSSGSSESLGSSSQGSVIRLNPSHGEDELPYSLTIPPVR